MSERAYRYWLIGITLFLMAWIAWPFFLYMQRAGYEGLVPFRTNDDGAYEDRIQTALLGRYDEVDNGITGPGIHGAGSASVELVTGFLLHDTGLHGPEAMMLLMIFIAPFFFPLFSLFLRTFGVSPGVSLLITTLFTALTLGSLQRPINLSFTLPYTALVLLIFSLARSKQGWFLPVLAMLLIGVLPGVYFWAWTFLWASLAAVLVLQLFLPRSGIKNSQLRRIVWMAGGSFLVALPLLFKTWLLQVTSPFFAETASYRSGVYPSHWVESPVRSILLLLLVIAAVTLFVRKKTERSTLILPVALVIGAFVVMHQNLIHGKDLMFSSHYYPFVCLVAVTMCAWVWMYDRPFDRWRPRVSQWPSLLILGITMLFVVAGFWDYRVTWQLPFAPMAALDLQHLAPALHQLDDGKRQMVLTDSRSALMVKAWTDDDVVFTAYVQSLLVSDADYIRRNCLSQALSSKGVDVRAVAWELTQYRGIAHLPEREAQVQSICTPFLKNLRTAMETYHVDLVLWDEKNHPDWVMDSALFQKIQSGSGWSLWEIRAR